MTKPVLNQIWTFLAVVLLYFSINVWSATQQWQFTLPGNPLKKREKSRHTERRSMEFLFAVYSSSHCSS